MDAVFSTINRQSSFVAIFLPFANLRAAWIPIGVAAFPKPRKLAQILLLKYPARTGSFSVEGKTRFKIGRSSLDKKVVKPAFSITLPTPDQRQIEPAMEKARVTPAWAPWGIAAARVEPFPKIKDATREIAKMPINIQLITTSITHITICGEDKEIPRSYCCGAA